MPLKRVQTGFSLLEVVIAAALLFTTVTAVTGVVTSSMRGAMRLSRGAEVDRALRLEVERLRSLPFCALTYPGNPWEPPVGGGEACDAVAELFPHAQLGCNTESDHWVGDGGDEDEPRGAFVSRRVRDGVTVTRVAWFASEDEVMVSAVDVAGWAVWGFASPPAATLVVRLTAALGDRRRWSCVVLRALPPAMKSSLPNEVWSTTP